MRLFSLVELKRKHSRWLLRSHGLRPHVLHLPSYGCQIHCWAPSSSLDSAAAAAAAADDEQTSVSSSPSPLSANCNSTPHDDSADSLPSDDVKQSRQSPSKPALVLLHGFGPDGSVAWDYQVAQFSKHFSLYLPDLLFFGNSTIADKFNASPDFQTQHTRSAAVEEEVKYSEIFQARCMHEALQKLGVREAVVAGHSYGGFVAYYMAHLYPSFVKKLVVMSSGIMMNPHSNDLLLSKYGSTCVRELLVPPTLPLFIRSLQLVFNDFLPTWLPSFLYRDLYETLGGDREGRLRLADDSIVGKEGAPPLPSIEQSTLIFWGEEDQIFDISLAHQLKEFMGAKATLTTIKGVGHVPHLVKPKEFNRVVLSSLIAKE